MQWNIHCILHSTTIISDIYIYNKIKTFKLRNYNIVLYELKFFYY